MALAVCVFWGGRGVVIFERGWVLREGWDALSKQVGGRLGGWAAGCVCGRGDGLVQVAGAARREGTAGGLHFSGLHT